MKTVEKAEIEVFDKPVKVYNFEVEDWHTYFVTEQGILVHNAGQDYDGNNTRPNPKSTKKFGHTFDRHGAGTKNTNRLIGRARGTGKNQGQWLDNQKAADFLDSLGNINEPTTVSIPEGLGQVITPTGEILPADKAIVVPSLTGIKTAYPILGAE